jgi:hypothetical protein
MAGLGLANSRDFKRFRPRELVFRNQLHMLRSKSRVLNFTPNQNKFKFFREDMPNPGHRDLQKSAQPTPNPGHRDLQQAAWPNKKAVALAPPVKNVIEKVSLLPPAPVPKTLKAVVKLSAPVPKTLKAVVKLSAPVPKTLKAVVKLPAPVPKTPKATGKLKIRRITKLRIKVTVKKSEAKPPKEISAKVKTPKANGNTLAPKKVPNAKKSYKNSDHKHSNKAIHGMITGFVKKQDSPVASQLKIKINPIKAPPIKRGILTKGNLTQIAEFKPKAIVNSKTKPTGIKINPDKLKPITLTPKPLTPMTFAKKGPKFKPTKPKH